MKEKLLEILEKDYKFMEPKIEMNTFEFYLYVEIDDFCINIEDIINLQSLGLDQIRLRITKNRLELSFDKKILEEALK